MQFPARNHKPPQKKDPIPSTVESNAKLLEEQLEKINWKRVMRFYWWAVACLVGGIMAFIIGIGVANKIVSTF
tara:strand:+ start:662 stop:880 length:219 start_codon:yes stop_codon:yes gene_type:complete